MSNENTKAPDVVNALNLSKLSGVELIHLVNGMMIRNQQLQDMQAQILKGVQEMTDAKSGLENGLKALINFRNEAMKLIGETLCKEGEELTGTLDQLEAFFKRSGGEIQSPGAPFKGTTPPVTNERKSFIDQIKPGAGKKTA